MIKAHINACSRGFKYDRYRRKCVDINECKGMGSHKKLCKITYLLIDLDGGNVPLALVAIQRRGFSDIRHCDWLSPKVVHFRRRGRLLDIGHLKKSRKKHC